MSIGNDWSEYRPSKTLWFWSLVGACAMTIVVGFAWAGWWTAGGASKMSELAARNARAELVSQLCVHRFVSSPDAAKQLAALKEKSTWERDDFVKQGGWTRIAGIDEAIPNAAEDCASKLVEIEDLTPTSAVTDS